MAIQVHGSNWTAYKKLKWTSNDTSISPQTLWNLSTFALEELVHNIIVRTGTGEDFHVLHVHNNVKFSKGIQIRVQRIATEGQCYTLQIDSALKALQLVQIRIKWLAN